MHTVDYYENPTFFYLQSYFHTVYVTFFIIIVVAVIVVVFVVVVVYLFSLSLFDSLVHTHSHRVTFMAHMALGSTYK